MEWLIVFAAGASVLVLAMYALTAREQPRRSEGVVGPDRRLPDRRVVGGRAGPAPRPSHRARASERSTETARKHTPAGYADEGPAQASPRWFSEARRCRPVPLVQAARRLLGSALVPVRLRHARHERRRRDHVRRPPLGVGVLPARRHGDPADRGAAARDPQAAPRGARPPHDLGRSGTRLRPGGRAHRARPSPARSATSSNAC